MSLDNPKVAVEAMEFGKGLVAVAPIQKDEIIAAFDGKIYVTRKPWEIPKDIAQHVIQIGSNKWKDSRGIAKLANHSCEPNLGIRGSDTLVAMRDIQKGERLTWDYEMSERGVWRMQCLCGAPSCRKIIGTYDNMPLNVRRRYQGYISQWIALNSKISDT